MINLQMVENLFFFFFFSFIKSLKFIFSRSCSYMGLHTRGHQTKSARNHLQVQIFHQFLKSNMMHQ